MKQLEEKYSPGPWEAIDYYYKTYVKNESETIAQLPGCGGKFRANADLISAAPELLECLKEAVYNFDFDSCRDCPRFDSEAWKCSFDGDCPAQRWLAAIRKAEGIK